MGQLLKSIWKLQLVQNAAGWANNGAGFSAHQFLKLHWLSICFWMQLKVLVVTFKALHDSGPGYLWDQLFLVVPTRPIQSSRRGTLWVLSASERQLVRPWRTTSSAMVSTLWNIIPPEIRLPPRHLLAFHKVLKTWFCGSRVWDGARFLATLRAFYNSLVGVFIFCFNIVSPYHHHVFRIFSLKRWLRVDMIAVFQNVKGSHREEGVDLFSRAPVCERRTKGRKLYSLIQNWNELSGCENY